MPDNKGFDHNKGWQSKSVATNYDERRFRSFTGKLYDSMEKKVIQNLLSQAEISMPINKILDIPCGTGRISESLLRNGYQVECGDISQEMLNVAKQRLENLPGFLGTFLIDVYNINRESATYDCVSCIRLFQHLQSEQRALALKELARVSRKFVIVNVMYTSTYYGMIRKIRKKLGRYAPKYVTTKDELIKETEFASLKIAKYRFSQPGLNGNLVLLLEKV